VDCCGLANVEVETNAPTTVTFTGTSCAAPMVAGMCALVNDYMIQHIGRPLSHDEMYHFIVANCRDIHTAGKDKKTGYGLFILPDPDSIDLSIYAGGEMMEKTNTGLVEYARAQLGRPYWMGTFGQTATAGLYTYNKGRLPEYYTATDFPSQYGQRVHDCIGLVKGYLWSDGPDATPAYRAAPCTTDHSADNMLTACTEKGPISTIPEIPGVLVFMSEHVGVYIGGGEVIEARGHAYGVVQTRLQDRPWVNWGKCPYITYQEVDDMTEDRVRAIFAEEIAKATYAVIADVPEYWRSETQALMTAGAINGGTPDDVNDKDVDMSRDALKAAIICKRYVDLRIGG